MADWYVHSVGEFPWFVNEKFGARGFLVPFADDVQVGVRVHVLEPGKPSTLYHRETGQEGFLVVEGECLLIVEGEERPLQQWDYFHCPPGTTHAFVGAGDGPCVMVTLGLRGGADPVPSATSTSRSRTTRPRSRRRRPSRARRTSRSRSGKKAYPAFVARASLEPRLLASDRQTSPGRAGRVIVPPSAARNDRRPVHAVRLLYVRAESRTGRARPCSRRLRRAAAV